ncbi:MAG: asparagine synthase-related protein, partial [Candidatus Binataceae bacterium]
SGIAGLFNLDGAPVDRAAFERVVAAGIGRGPDAQGCWFDGPIALGHTMLRTTPEAREEKQPLIDEQAGLGIVLDGRIDNRAELISALKARGASLTFNTDAELVLRAYELWGENAPSRLIGDFAFVIWDGPQRRLFCARDPVGIKPFCYWSDNRAFLCASEICQLLQDARVPRQPNEAMIAEQLTGSLYSADETLFQNIMRLPPGHQMVVRADKIEIRRYFDPNNFPEVRYAGDDDYAARFLELFTEAVRCRMRASSGIGADLSGGLDSSSITCIAQRLLRGGMVNERQFETFSLIYDEPEADERAYIRDVVEHAHVPSNFVPGLVLDAAACEAKVRGSLDLPEYPNGATANSARSLMQQKRFRILLSGIGGDDWLWGDGPHYSRLIKDLRLAELVQRLRDDARLIRLDPTPTITLAKIVLKDGFWPLLPQPAREAIKRGLRYRNYPEWLAPDLVRRTNLKERLRIRSDTLLPGNYTRVMEMEERKLAHRGIEGRYPFHDLRLIAFACGIPEEQRRSGDRHKYV